MFAALDDTLAKLRVGEVAVKVEGPKLRAICTRRVAALYTGEVIGSGSSASALVPNVLEVSSRFILTHKRQYKYKYENSRPGG